jgi:hypothetical protein
MLHEDTSQVTKLNYIKIGVPSSMAPQSFEDHQLSRLWRFWGN